MDGTGDVVENDRCTGSVRLANRTARRTNLLENGKGPDLQALASWLCASDKAELSVTPMGHEAAIGVSEMSHKLMCGDGWASTLPHLLLSKGSVQTLADSYRWADACCSWATFGCWVDCW
jgi:hypothetical protein